MQVVDTATRLTLIRGLSEYSLSDATVLFDTSDGPVYFVYEADNGIGMAPLTRFAERGPSQHGDTDLGFMLEPRSLSYIFGIFAPGNTRDTRHLETARMLLLQRFRPSLSPLSLRYDRANGDVMQIDGHFAEGMQFGSTERIEGTWYQRFSVNLKMNDPTWYNPTLHVSTATDDLWEGGTPVPMSVPTPVGRSRFIGTTVIEYAGSWDTYPTLRVTGPIHDFQIYNVAGEQDAFILPFSGFVPHGSYWDIILESGSKSVVDEDGNSMLAYLGDPNHLSTFRIVAEPDADGGINSITMSGYGANGDTSLQVTYTDRYVGI
jgi:hypothetical protein